MATADFSFIRQCQYAAKENEEECQEEQYSICPCCNLWLCSPHLQEHQQMVQTNVHAVNDRANQVRQQLSELSVDYLYEDSKKKIDEWRDQINVEINARHVEMLQKLTTLHNELTEEVKKFKTKNIESFPYEIVEPLSRLLSKQKQVHPQSLKTIETRLKSLEWEIEDIKDPDLIHTNCDEIKLNGEINFTREYTFDDERNTLKCWQPLSLASITQKAVRHFPLKSTHAVISASPHHILAVESPSRLVLFDTNSQLRSIDIKKSEINDMCWSDTLKLFLIAGAYVDTYDVLSNALRSKYHIRCIDEDNALSITSYHYDMFLLREGNGIIERYSLPSFQLEKKWSNDVYLEKDRDVVARCIRMNSNGVLAVSIKANDLCWRIDLFNLQMQRLHRGIPFTKDERNDVWSCMFNPMINNEWIVMINNSKTQMLVVLDAESKLKEQVKIKGYNVAPMNEEWLVLCNNKGLYLYELSE